MIFGWLHQKNIENIIFIKNIKILFMSTWYNFDVFLFLFYKSPNNWQIISIIFLDKCMSLFGKSSTKFSFSFYFSQKYQIKNILTFLHFLHHINNFLLLFNQKNPLQNKTFSFFYKTFSNFLSHQSFLTTIQINIPFTITYQTALLTTNIYSSSLLSSRSYQLPYEYMSNFFFLIIIYV